MTRAANSSYLLIGLNHARLRIKIVMQPDALDHVDIDHIDLFEFEETSGTDAPGVIALIAGAGSGASVVALIWLFTELLF